MQTARFARSRLRADLSVVDGTFDRYVDQPWRAGAFDLRNPRRTMAILKASHAAALDVRLLGIAARNVRANPTLCNVLLPPINELKGSLAGFKAQALAGHFGFMGEAEQALATVERRAASARLGLGDTTR